MEPNEFNLRNRYPKRWVDNRLYDNNGPTAHTVLPALLGEYLEQLRQHS